MLPRSRSRSRSRPKMSRLRIPDFNRCIFVLSNKIRTRTKQRVYAKIRVYAAKQAYLKWSPYIHYPYIYHTLSTIAALVYVGCELHHKLLTDAKAIGTIVCVVHVCMWIVERCSLQHQKHPLSIYLRVRRPAGPQCSGGGGKGRGVRHGPPVLLGHSVPAGGAPGDSSTGGSSSIRAHLAAR